MLKREKFGDRLSKPMKTPKEDSLYDGGPDVVEPGIVTLTIT